jgi:hypothetical protein
MNRRALLLLPAAAAAGCLKQPDNFSPPEPRNPLVLEENRPLLHYVPMGAEEAPAHFLDDILPELHDGQWRWTLQRPTLEVRVPTTRGLRFRAQLTVPEITFEQTGPVTIQVFIDNRRLTEQRIDAPGETVIEQPVAPDWLTTGRPIVIRFVIDKLWESPVDGIKRGFILTGAGFVQ